MKMHHFAILLTLGIVSCAGLSRATTTGYDSAPLGDRAGADIGHALWDAFPAAQFTGAAPATASGPGVFDGTLSSTTDGMLTGGGERIYSLGNAFGFTIDGTTASGAASVVLQLKFTTPSAGSASSFFTVTLNGNAASSVEVQGTSTEGSNTFNILKYTWTGLSVAAGGDLDFAISSAADHSSLDGIALDVAASAAAATPTATPAVAPEAPNVGIKSGARIAREKFTLKGRIAAPGTHVEYAVGKGGFKKAAGGEQWKVALELKRGRNVIRLRAVDDATGLVSQVRKIVIVRRK